MDFGNAYEPFCQKTERSPSRSSVTSMMPSSATSRLWKLDAVLTLLLCRTIATHATCETNKTKPQIRHLQLCELPTLVEIENICLRQKPAEGGRARHDPRLTYADMEQCLSRRTSTVLPAKRWYTAWSRMTTKVVDFAPYTKDEEIPMLLMDIEVSSYPTPLPRWCTHGQEAGFYQPWSLAKP